MIEKQLELITIYIPKFINMLNLHRRLSVAAAWDLAKDTIPEVTVANLDEALSDLVERKLISFSRTNELFYLGKLPEQTERQQPLPAEHIEALLQQVKILNKEVIDLKLKKAD
jgi:hypothetical protein